MDTENIQEEISRKGSHKIIRENSREGPSTIIINNYDTFDNDRLEPQSDENVNQSFFEKYVTVENIKKLGYAIAVLFSVPMASYGIYNVFADISKTAELAKIA